MRCSRLGGGRTMNELVTVGNFQFLPEAEAARMHLESHGIPAFLADAETVNMDWLLGNAIGYIKLQVASGRAEEAETILERVHAQRGATEAESAAGADTVECLQCG